MNPLPLIWLAMASSQLLFAGVSWVLWPGPDPSAATTVWVLAAMAAPLSLASVIGPGLLLRGDDPGAQRSRYIMRWAFAEAVTLMGFVATYQGGPQWLCGALAAWSLVLLLLAYPTDTLSVD